MPILRRLWYTPAMVSRSSSARASPSTIDASVTSSTRVILSVSSRAFQAGCHSALKPSAMSRTSSRAEILTGTR